jgi:WD40 repeat protein
MNEQKDNLQPETIDRVIESGGFSQQDHQTTRLIQHLYVRSQAYAQANERSLDRIWSRIVQSQEHPVSLQASLKQPEGRIITIKEKEAMQDTNISGGMNSLPSLSKPKKRRSLLRVVGTSLVAAAVVITILSFAFFSGVLRPGSQTPGKGSSTLTGAPQSPQQTTISNGKLVCSVGLDVRALPPFGYSITSVNWSTQGKIAAASTQNFTTFSAKDCSAKSTKTAMAYEESWSPDGTKLAIADSSADALEVLDSNGNSIANIPFTQLGATSVGTLVWSSDGTKLIFIALEANHQSGIKSVDAANGGNVKTLMALPNNGNGITGLTDLSPNGRYAIVTQLNAATKMKDHSIWDVNTGKKVSNLPSDDGKGSFGKTVFSPDGSLVAVAGNEVRIYTTATGSLLTSFGDQNAAAVDGVAALAWSPDGKYLAESASSINIYDVHMQKIVTTFGKVDAHHKIFGLAWAPGGAGLVSATDQLQDDGHSQTPVNVWALSQGS